MAFFNRRDAYGAGGIVLHWLLAILLAVQAGTVLYTHAIHDGLWRLDVFFWHRQAGVYLAATAAMAMGWRFFSSGVDDLSERGGVSALFGLIRWLTHYGFYLLFIALGLSGIMLLQTAGKDTNIFGFAPPPLEALIGEWIPGLSAADSKIQHLKMLHAILGYGIGGLAVLHLADVLFRRYVLGHSVLRRMLSTFPEDRRRAKVDHRELTRPDDNRPRSPGRRWEDRRPADGDDQGDAASS